MYNQYTTLELVSQGVELEFIPYLWDSDTYGDIELPTVPEKKSGQNKKNWQIEQERQERYQDAENLLKEYAQDDYVSVLQAVGEYYSEYSDVIPYPLRYSPREQGKEAFRAFNRKTMPAARLFAELDNPHLYTLHASHLGLSEVYSDSSNFRLGSYDPKLRSVWRKAIQKKFGKAARFIKWENAERFHVHIIAEHDAALPEISRSGEIIKPITDEKGMMAYLLKPHAANTEKNLAEWIHAKRILGQEGKTLPHMCGYYNLPEVEKIESTNPSDYSVNVIKKEYIEDEIEWGSEYIHSNDWDIDSYIEPTDTSMENW